MDGGAGGSGTRVGSVYCSKYSIFCRYIIHKLQDYTKRNFKANQWGVSVTSLEFIISDPYPGSFVKIIDLLSVLIATFELMDEEYHKSFMSSSFKL